MKDTMRPPSKDKPPRNRDQILPLRKGDTLERTTREPKDRGRKAPSREEEMHESEPRNQVITASDPQTAASTDVRFVPF